ncbi:MAG: alpha/beta hydrolase [Oscillospiraceae bacterium]|nr:alpha/beta hydrolase [Oscillospiraceae bacterium]
MLIFLFLQLILTLILTVGIVLLLVLAASWATYYIAFHSPRKGQDDPFNIPAGDQYMDIRDQMHDMITTLNDLPFERVYITSEDGLRLSGRYYHQADGAPLDIGFHGYRGTPVRDFCGGSQISFALGHNVLLVDQRAQGKSEGHTITFGIKERFDCLDWIRYALDRFGKDTKITLYGVSMGASTVLMASGLNLPENVRCIIADCPYSSPEAIIRKVCTDMGLPHKIVYPFVSLGAWAFGGFRLSETDAAEALRLAKVPVMIIHGEEDRFVPCGMSRELSRLNPNIELHTIPGAGHGISFMVDRPGYEKAVREFLEKHL